jgi:hypothetical protein
LAEANQDIAELTAEKATLTAENDLLTKQVSLIRAGGRYQEAAWFDQHKAIVDHAQEIGSQLATVFLGDSLINEAVGGKSEAEIKTIYTNISTPRIHVAAIDGATVEEIIWGIRNGWLPTKTAYTIVHAGRAEIIENITALEGPDDVLSRQTGVKIGSIYPALIDQTKIQTGTDGIQANGNATSVIFSGVVTPTSGPGSTIHVDNPPDINGANGIQSVVPTDGSTPMYNTFISIFNNTDINTLLTNGVFDTRVSILNADRSAIRLAGLLPQKPNKMDYRHQKGAQGCQSPFFWINFYQSEG